MVLMYLQSLPALPSLSLSSTSPFCLSLSLFLSVSKSHAPWPVQPTAAAAAAPGTASFSSRSTKTQSLPSLLQDKSNTCKAWRVEEGRPSESSAFGKRAALEQKTKDNFFPQTNKSCKEATLLLSESPCFRIPKRAGTGRIDTILPQCRFTGDPLPRRI